MSFEGPEGSGKSTQIKLLERALREQNTPVWCRTREPGGTPIGEQIRDVLHDPREPGHVTQLPKSCSTPPRERSMWAR